jgi:hypothetical protein
MWVSGQLHASAALHREGAPGSDWTGCWEGLRGGLDAVAKKKIPAPVGNRSLVVQPVASHCTDLAVPSHMYAILTKQ